jgi:hypothetical protein
MTELHCYCGGWNNWDFASSDWHEIGCPFPLSVKVSPATVIYSNWALMFRPPMDYPELHEPRVDEYWGNPGDSYTEWYDRYRAGDLPLGGIPK